MKQVVSSGLSWPEARADEEMDFRQLARDVVLCFFAAPFRLIVVYSFGKIFASDILAEGMEQGT